MQYPLPLTQFAQMVKQQGNNHYLHQPVNRELKSFSWSEVDRQARGVAAALQEMGYATGDRIGILSKNCAEWFISDLAIMMAGMISVPIYHTANRDTISHIMQDSECKAVFVGKLDGMDEAEAGISANIPRIIFPYPSIPGQHQWSSMVEHDPIVDVYQPAPDDTMSIAYTSGSTGKPKGVVISYLNIASAATESGNLLDVKAGDRLVSYLPLAHITERSLIETLSYYTGTEVYFVESLDTFVDDLKVAQPDFFVSVPRLWNKFQGEVLNKMPDRKLQILLKIPFIGKLVAKKIRLALGLNSCRAFGSGTAPISPSILRWFHRIGMPISEGWGMTETSGMSCGNTPFTEIGLGTIGRPIPCVEMKLGDNQEILIKGPAVFKGYYNRPDATAESFTGEWFHTGDMGEITDNGEYKIIGRTKEQFKSAKGKYVAPAPIENLIGRNNDVEQVCVMGQGRKQPIALVVMNEKNKTRTAANQNGLEKTLHIVNKKLEKHQQLDHIIVLKDNWTIENELLTPTMKIKRSSIEAKFADYLEKDLDNKVCWE
jgi:long-subunit acyl-CoA synthetase (AMP-forming)